MHRERGGGHRIERCSRDYALVNRGALIGHDDRIGKYCTIGPGANIAGDVEIGDGALVAQGTVVRERMIIGSGPSSCKM